MKKMILNLSGETARDFDSARIGDRVETETNALYRQGPPETRLGRVVGRTASGWLRIEWAAEVVDAARFGRKPKPYAYARSRCYTIRFYGPEAK